MRFFWIDSFADRPFAGNPAGVCLLPEPLADATMQGLARELGLSETAFALRQGDHFELRWFTPEVEVSLCGHATLASAHALWESGLIPEGSPIRFHTQSGVLSAEKRDGLIFLDFPALPVRPFKVAPKELLGDLREGLGVGSFELSVGEKSLLLELESEAILRSIHPDFGRLARIPFEGVIVTSVSASPQFDFVSRYFGPREGIPEDPVTGFAHCHLGPYWERRLGKNEFSAFQASRRGGALQVAVRGDRVRLGGRAITVMSGEIAGEVLGK